MALGAWLLLFQSNLTPGGVGGPGGVEILTTHAPNTLPLTGYHDSFVHEVAKENTQALILGATGESFVEDETIAEGHTHTEGAHSALLWRQIATFVLHNISLVTGAVGANQVYDALAIEQTLETDLAFVRLLLDPVQACAVIPRVRVSCDAAATDTARICLRYYQPDGTLYATQSPAISVSTSIAKSREWEEGSALDLSGADRDADITTRIPLIVRVSGYMDSGTEQLSLHELSFGVDT